MRYAGMHWPANAGGEHPNRETIASLPGVQNGATLICSDSARWHYDYMRERSPLVIWRAIPELDSRPALLGWDANRVADACLLHYGEQTHSGVEYFQPLNELQFERENGAPFPRYGEMAQNLARLRVQLRRKFAQLYPGSSTLLIFPPWVPQDEGDHLEDWQAEAVLWDVVGLHAYGSAETMYGRYMSYRQMFPEKPLLVGEWNANHEGHSEYEALAMWGYVQEHDPLFVAATYYIWETQNPGEGDLSVWGSSTRLSLFQYPPTPDSFLPYAEQDPTPEPAPEPAPDPETDPAPLEPSVPDKSNLPQGIDIASFQGYTDFSRVASGGYAFVATKLTEGTNYFNAYAEQNWGAIKQAGLYRIAYHFARPDLNGPEVEAGFLVDALRALGMEPGDIVALDIEDTPAGMYARAKAKGVSIPDWTSRWAAEIQSSLGFFPILYLNRSTVEEEGFDQYPQLGELGLWLASWQGSVPLAPAPWLQVAFWQDGVYSSVPGVSGECDHDYFIGDAASIPLYGMPSPVPQPAPDPTPPRPTALDYAGLINLVGNAYNQDSDVYQAIKRIASGKNRQGKNLTKANMEAEARGVLGFLDANRPKE